MKKILKFCLILVLILTSSPIVLASDNLATVFNQDTMHRKVVNIGDKTAFDGGYLLETSFGYKENENIGYSVSSGYDERLSRSMTSSQTTIYVTSTESKDGHQYTMADFGTKVFLTIEPGGIKEEIVMCTAVNSSSWYTCTRGLAFYGESTASVAANQYPHTAGSRIIMSNVHYVYEQLIDNDTDQTLSGDITMTGTTTFTNDVNFSETPLGPSAYTSNDNGLITLGQANTIASQGAATGTETSQGIWEGATQSEMADSAETGSSGNLVLMSKYSSDFPTSTDIISDQYEVSNYNTTNTIRSGGFEGAAQSFNNVSGILSSIKFYISKFGSPTGSIYANIFAHSGTFGSNSVGTGAALATSSAVDISTLSTSLAQVEFSFTGANAITLNSANNYVLRIYYNGGNSSNYLKVGIDSTSPSHDGNYSYYANATGWTPYSGYDMIFELNIANKSYVPVSESDGYLNQGWIDLSEDFAFTGETSFSSTTTLSNITIGDSVVAMTASTTLTGATLPQPVYIASSTNANAGGVLLVDGNVQDTLGFIGFAVTNAAAGTTVYVQTDGIVDGFTGLTKGADYYVSDTAGVLSTTMGTYDVFVGTAISATEILMQKREYQYIGSVTVANNSSVAIRSEARKLLISWTTAAVNDLAKGVLELNKKGITAATVGIKAGDTGSAATELYSAFTWSGNILTTSNDELSGNATVYMYR